MYSKEAEVSIKKIPRLPYIVFVNATSGEAISD